MSSVIPHDLGEELDLWLEARQTGVVYTIVNGVPIVGVPVADLIGRNLDEAAADMPPELLEMFPD